MLTARELIDYLLSKITDNCDGICDELPPFRRCPSCLAKDVSGKIIRDLIVIKNRIEKGVDIGISLKIKDGTVPCPHGYYLNCIYPNCRKYKKAPLS